MSFGAMVKAAKPTGGGNQIRDGLYELMVEKIELVDGTKFKSYVVEFRVLKSTPASVTDDNGKPIVPNPVGSSCSFVCRMDFDAAPGNIHAFCIGLYGGLGYAEDAITGEMIDKTYAVNNPFRGVRIIDETYQGTNKGRRNAANAGKKLTLHKWKSIEGQSATAIKEGRAKLDTTIPTADVQAPAAAPAAPAAAPAAPAAAPKAVPAPVAASSSDPDLDALLGL